MPYPLRPEQRKPYVCPVCNAKACPKAADRRSQCINELAPGAPDPRDLILHAMADRGVNQAELARRMGITSPACSQMLKPGRNWEIETLGRALAALDYQLVIEAQAAAQRTRSPRGLRYVYPEHTAGKP